MNTTPSIDQLHDATLVSIQFDWARCTCTINFFGAPNFDFPFCTIFTEVRSLSVPSEFTWGRSSSVLEMRELPEGKFEIEMQSGDTISIIAPNPSFRRTPVGAAKVKR